MLLIALQCSFPFKHSSFDRIGVSFNEIWWHLIQCLTSKGHLQHLQQFSFYTQIYTRPVKLFPINSFFTNAPKLSTPTLGRQALLITHLSSPCPLPILNINYQHSDLYSCYNTLFLLTNSVKWSSITTWLWIFKSSHSSSFLSVTMHEHPNLLTTSEAQISFYLTNRHCKSSDQTPFFFFCGLDLLGGECSNTQSFPTTIVKRSHRLWGWDFLSVTWQKYFCPILLTTHISMFSVTDFNRKTYTSWCTFLYINYISPS